jgi:Xylose isomerase-like TIM barrel
MKFGVNTQIWVAPFQQSDIDLIDKAAKLGFDVIELGFFSAEPPFNVEDVKQRLRDTGLTPGICTFLSADRDITSADPDSRRRGVEFMRAMIGTLAKLGGEVFSGPIYAELFRKRYLKKAEREAEWERGVKSLREVAKTAETQAAPLLGSCSTLSIWGSKREIRAQPFAALASISSTSIPARTTGALRGPGRSLGLKFATRSRTSVTIAPSPSKASIRRSLILRTGLASGARWLPLRTASRAKARSS